MVPSFEILLDCNKRVLELKKEETTWVPTDWADHMDPDAMTTLLRDHICKEQPLVMMKIEVKTRVIIVVTIAVMIVDIMMMIATPIVMTTAVEIMIAHTVEMIGVNSLVIEKMKIQTYSMRNMTVMWTTMIEILKMTLKLTGGATLIVINTG